MVRLSRARKNTNDLARLCVYVLSVPTQRALWSAIRSAASAGARSRGAAAPCPAVRCPFDVFLEATLPSSSIRGVPSLASKCRVLSTFPSRLGNGLFHGLIGTTSQMDVHLADLQCLGHVGFEGFLGVLEDQIPKPVQWTLRPPTARRRGCRPRMISWCNRSCWRG